LGRPAAPFNEHLVTDVGGLHLGFAVVLAGVGHVPMIDDAQNVARTILHSTEADRELHART
jgi:hypothetical protein